MTYSRLISATLMIGIGAFATSATADTGEQIFGTRCQVCHSITPDKKHGPIAPNLRGVVGRKAASTSFRNYSPALSKSQLVWTQATLAKFLAAPGKTVPGTGMAVSVPSAADRDALIAYLATLK